MPLTSFRRRDPIPLAAGAVAVTLALVAAALGVGELPYGVTYSAEFAESAGLRVNDDVVIAGVRVGRVSAVELDGGHVRVGLRVPDDLRLGSLTRADIRIKTLLGAHHVVLDPRGPGRLRGPIPLSRTSVPYEVVAAVNDLSQSADRIDERELASAMTVLARTVDGSSEEIRSALDGLGRLSRTIASREDGLRDLVRRARTVTGLLARRDTDLTALIRDGDLVLREIAARRAAIHGLLVNTVLLTRQIDGLIADNRATLKPMLRRLRAFTGVLRRNEESLERTLALLAPFVRQLADTGGNGRWVDTIVQNLLPLPASVRFPDRTLGGLTR